MDDKKQLAKLKRQSMDIAGQIHDIVEDSLWEDYTQLPDLSQKLIQKIEEYREAKKAAEA